MKVLVITNLFPNRSEPNRATFNYQQISELSKFCDVTVIAPISWLMKFKQIIKNKAFQGYSINNESVTTFYPTYFYIPKYLRCFYGVFYFISILFRGFRCIVNDRPDALLGTWAYPDGFSVILLGKLFKIPVVIKVHGTDIHSVDTNCRRSLTSWTLTRANKVISVSQNLANTMCDEFSVLENSINVIQNGVDTKKFYSMDKYSAFEALDLQQGHSKHIIFIGNLKPEKNPLVLFEAFSKVLDQSSKDVCLHYIGDGPLRLELESMISEKKLIQNVVMHGSVSHDKIPIWLNAADILVLPSSNEGMPNVVLESIACNTPVVASKVGGIPEVVEQNITGLLVEPGNVEQLKSALLLALGKEWNMEKFVSTSKIQTWENTAIRLRDCLAAEVSKH